MTIGCSRQQAAGEYIEKEKDGMWISKVMSVIENEDGSQELGIVNIFADQKLRTVYESAMWECKDQKCALAAIYSDISIEEVFRDDPTKKETKALYQINKGKLGGILVWGRNHCKKLHTIRENRAE